jgi:hypothetical protein
MSAAATKAVLGLRGLTTTERVVLLNLAYWHSDTEGTTFRAQSELAADCELDKSTVSRAIGTLIAKQHLVVDTPARQHRAARYRLPAVSGLRPDATLSAPGLRPDATLTPPPALRSDATLSDSGLHASGSGLRTRGSGLRPDATELEKSEIEKSEKRREAVENSDWDTWTNPLSTPEQIAAAMAAYRAESKGWAREVKRRA